MATALIDAEKQATASGTAANESMGRAAKATASTDYYDLIGTIALERRRVRNSAEATAE
ncbi:MAG: hypothetical protein VX245_11560 [Pseudomonadota bacterium]|jgi:hypothetical protein|uniref:hypothetical protein n=1 Tax=Thalassolituus sp. UBA2590 TaxID=1947663 RepID=UPI002648912B|nr:hypothetical protein [Thalassolituus sp. UBA2590]MEC8907585.1 hypothetical protein [Pseudomonadota bacterium]MEC9254401.1 hypothetical protein [Pseudomonadota bacterium]MED5440098.1 hypothetical protein [Pseudomonadota bacterium]MEE3191231.1 hypothetical protein [Pseudomonadota bacterium]MEE3210593.1 hypothetical protein [Pseudomonadota bacterium]